MAAEQPAKRKWEVVSPWYADGGASAVREPFYAEQGAFPLAHFVLNWALHAATRDVRTTVLLAYVFETYERLAETRRGTTPWLPRWRAEQWDDSWIGDPAMSFVAAGALNALLLSTASDEPALAWRTVPFVVTFALVAATFRNTSPKASSAPAVRMWSLLLVYTASTLLVNWGRWRTMPALLGAPLAACLLALPSAAGVSVYRRVFVTALLVWSAALIAQLVRAAR